MSRAASVEDLRLEEDGEDVLTPTPRGAGAGAGGGSAIPTPKEPKGRRVSAVGVGVGGGRRVSAVMGPPEWRGVGRRGAGGGAGSGVGEIY